MGSRKTLVFKCRIAASAEKVLKWHFLPETIDKLIPPWENVEVVKAATGPEDGQQAIFRMHLGPSHLDWVAEHCNYIEGRQFADKQLRGPFAYWLHTHIFHKLSDSECELEDRIEYEVPLAPLTQMFIGGFVRSKIERMFAYRHKVTKTECEKL